MRTQRYPLGVTSTPQSLLALLLRKNQMVRIDLESGDTTVVVDDTGPCPDGVAVVGDHVYWTTMGPPVIPPGCTDEELYVYTARNGGLHRAGLDGSGQTEMLPPGSLTTGKQLVSDGSETLYWGDREGDRVSRMRIDATVSEDVIVNHGGAPGTDECVGVAVDAARGNFYWTQKGPPKAGLGRIFRASTTTPPGEDPSHRSDIEVLWDGLPEPIDLEVAGDTLYWTDRGSNTLNRAKLPEPGGRGEPPQILADGFQAPIGLAIDHAAGVAYVSDLTGDVVAVSLPESGDEPGTRRTVASLGTSVTGILLHG